MLALLLTLVNYGGMTVEADEQTDFLGIHAAFVETEYAQVLSQNVRYGKYKPEDVSNERWEELLGPDVNNLNHLIDTYQLTRGFIRLSDRLQPGLLTPRDKKILKVAALIHDWGESIIPDINYFEKAADDEMAEQLVFTRNLTNFYTADNSEATQLITEATDKVVFDRESRLGGLFNIIERVGYLRTALQADKRAREGSAPDCKSHLRWLSAAVLSSDHTTHLIARSKQVLAAGHFVALREIEITDAFEAADPEIFTIHEPDKAAYRGQGLEEARLIWGAWCSGLNFSAI